MLSIEYSKAARKALKSNAGEYCRLIMEKIEALACDPLAVNNVKKLTNHPGYRLRVGNWRVVYLIHEQALLIAVVRIAREEMHANESTDYRKEWPSGICGDSICRLSAFPRTA